MRKYKHSCDLYNWSQIREMWKNDKCSLCVNNQKENLFSNVTTAAFTKYLTSVWWNCYKGPWNNSVTFAYSRAYMLLSISGHSKTISIRENIQTKISNLISNVFQMCVNGRCTFVEDKIILSDSLATFLVHPHKQHNVKLLSLCAK